MKTLISPIEFQSNKQLNSVQTQTKSIENETCLINIEKSNLTNILNEETPIESSFFTIFDKSDKFLKNKNQSNNVEKNNNTNTQIKKFIINNSQTDTIIYNSSVSSSISLSNHTYLNEKPSKEWEKIQLLTKQLKKVIFINHLIL